MSLVTLHCPDCQDERPFERPHDPASCPDRAYTPDGDCPELACVDCGAALLTATFAIPVQVRNQAADPARQHSPERAA